MEGEELKEEKGIYERTILAKTYNVDWEYLKNCVRKYESSGHRRCFVKSHKWTEFLKVYEDLHERAKTASRCWVAVYAGKVEPEDKNPDRIYYLSTALYNQYNVTWPKFLEEVTKNKDNSSDRPVFPTPPKHKNSEMVTDAFKTAYKQIRDGALWEKDQEAGFQDEIASNMDEPDTAAPAEEIEMVSILTIYQDLP
jgi:hypothetical protein